MVRELFGEGLPAAGDGRPKAIPNVEGSGPSSSNRRNDAAGGGTVPYQPAGCIGQTFRPSDESRGAGAPHAWTPAAASGSAGASSGDGASFRIAPLWLKSMACRQSARW